MLQSSLAEGVLFCPHCRAAYRSEFVRCPLDGARLAAEAQDPLIGRTISEHYTIEECIAYGATSRVYRAHHSRLTRRAFAIKILMGDLITSASTRIRFAQEAELLSRLNHPNVVTVVDFARTPEGLLYLVMDLATGPSLAELIRLSGPIQWRRVVSIAQQLCLGLGHAHDQGIVHRDFKPDNVIVEYSAEAETPRIVDFGIALTTDAEASPRLTGTGLTMGTPAYAAPEQTRNLSIDHRADLFALGVTLYEMLAGMLPFQGDATQLVHLNALVEPPPIRKRNPDVSVPPELEQVVRRLMMRDPEQRYASAYEALRALDEVVGTSTSIPTRASLTSIPLTTGPMRAVVPRTPPPPRDLALETIVLPGRGRVSMKVTSSRWPYVLIVGSLALIGVVFGIAFLGTPAASHGRAVATVEPAEPAPAEPAVADVPAPPSRQGAEAPAPVGAAEPVVATEPVVAAEARPGPAPVAAEPVREVLDPDPRTTRTTRGKRRGRTRAVARTAVSSRDSRKPEPKEVVRSASVATGTASSAPRSNEPGAPLEPTRPGAATTAPPGKAPAIRSTVVDATRRPVSPASAASSVTSSAASSAAPSPASSVAVPGAEMMLSGNDLKVTGSLSLRTVERAFNRVRGSVAGCARLSTKDVAVVRFVVDETGRATSVQVAGSGAGLSGCLRSALSGLRTEAPPDVGTVDAVLELSFSPKAAS